MCNVVGMALKGLINILKIKLAMIDQFDFVNLWSGISVLNLKK